MNESAPLAVVIAGPNGAGKSTLAPAIARDGFQLRDFVNADEIARGLSGFDPASAALQAGRLMLRRLEELASHRASFAFETTLATRSYAPWLRSLKTAGYRVELLFVWLPSSELAIQRVADRVRLGGHDIPVDVIRRRYELGLRNLFRLYLPIADRWTVVDNSVGGSLRVIAAGAGAIPEDVRDEALWTAFVALYGSENSP